MASRRTFAHLLLVLALLVAQQVLTAHPFLHRAAADPQDDQSAPAERVLCALCVAGAAAGSALPSPGHPPFISAAQVFAPAPVTWAHRPPLVRAFSARAPPILL